MNITDITYFVNIFSDRLSSFDSSVVRSEQTTAQETANSPAVAAISFISL